LEKNLLNIYDIWQEGQRTAILWIGRNFEAIPEIRNANILCERVLTPQHCNGNDHRGQNPAVIRKNIRRVFLQEAKQEPFKPILAKSDNNRKPSPPKYYFFRSAPAETDTQAFRRRTL
jgi:hypothetical protein